MASGIYRNNGAADPIISQIHSMLPNRSQKSTSGQTASRPSSAGATRRNNSSFGYNKTPPVNPTVYPATVTPGLFAQGYTSRPSSAGHSRPAPSAQAPAPVPVQVPIQQQQQQQQAYITPNQMLGQSASSSRPKSAGAVRREPGVPVAGPTAAPVQQPIYYMPQNAYGIYNPFQPAPARPSSANATPYSTAGLGLTQEWQYKPSAQAQASAQGPPVSATAPQPVGYKPAPTAVTKLRKAVDLSHKLEEDGVRTALPIAELAGLDNDSGDLLDERPLTTGAGAADDEEMDGKPLEHPEVSLTTPSAHTTSLDYPSAMDVRNTSLDSFSEDNIQIGLTTLPNQFCTKRDALELRKLLVLSAGTRGGIVPSSSAVMDMYMVGKVVGVGSYGKVRAAWHRLTSAKVAIKTYDKAKLKDPAHWKRVHSEIKIMEQISHPRIARLYEAVETPKRMHLIMECLDGGNLCSYVKAKRRLSEDESKRIFFQIMQAMEYLHALGVSHRDIKLENVLFANEKEIKLIDFGFSTVCQPGKKLKVFCGTPSYMAPEIVRRAEYEGKPVDMWSLGILLYALLCGCFPFRAKAYPDLYRRIARGAFVIPEELSAPVKDLLRQLLTVEVEQRITAHAAIRHPWLQQCLLNAPNMDKMRSEITILISDKPADDLDEQVLSELTVFGMSRDEMIRLVLTKTHSSLSTLYYLLLDTLVNRRRSTSKRPPGPSMAALPSQRPMSANYASHTNANIIKPMPAPMTRAAPVPGQQQQGQGTYDNLIQQQVAEQLAAQQQQQMLERQEYRYRPKSASQNRGASASMQQQMQMQQMQMQQQQQAQQTQQMPLNMANLPTQQPLQQAVQQRPLSAFAGRR